MKTVKIKLNIQLILIMLLTLLIAFFSMIVVIPKVLTPIYENNLYNLLSEPMKSYEKDDIYINNDVAYIVVSDQYFISKNYYKVVKVDSVDYIVSNAKNTKGKIKYNDKVYYYVRKNVEDNEVILISNDDYVLMQKNKFNSSVLPILLITSTITILVLSLYGGYLVKKINKIKEKVLNFDNKKYDHSKKFSIDDELMELNELIEKTRLSLIEKEEYKNYLFQNVSHELKTPIMVINSHLEASLDNIITKDEAISVIKEETDKLLNQVGTILQLNKIEYLKNTSSLESINIEKIIKKNIEKYKLVNNKIKFNIDLDKKEYYGNNELWDTVISNIISNFMRYAKSEIKITSSDNDLIFYNDGNHIDKNLINNVFEPYKKGKDGKTGLGLYIVKTILNNYNYNIKVNNKLKGIEFIIQKNE